MTRLFLICLAIVMALGWFVTPVTVRAQDAPTATPGPWIAVARGTVDPEGGLIRLAAQREGLIAEVMVEEGDHVTAGQPLARIDDTSAKLQMQLAQGEAEQARTQTELARMRSENAAAEVERLAPLARADAVPRRQFNEAKRTAALAAVELEASEKSLALQKTRLAVQQADIDARIIRAPVAGVILRRSARPGGGTTTQTVTEMFLLAPDGPRVLRAQLDEQFVGLVQPGQRAEVMREREDGTAPIIGRVARVAAVFGSSQPAGGNGGGGDSSASDQSRTVEITIILDTPKEAIDRLVLGQRMIARILK